MFSNSTTTSSSFQSTWKKERVTNSAGIQTEKITSTDTGVQLIYKSSVSTQTEEEALPIYKVPEYDEASLVSYLRRVAPKVEKELEKSIRSRAFVGYSINEDISITQAKNLHTLKWQLNDEHVITCLDWSATGSMVGVGYGMAVHDGWCSHKGAIAFWNINRPDFVPNHPDDHLEVSTCVTCLSFHPTNPAIVAVGNKSGEILIYDLTTISDAMAIHSGDSEGVEITALRWEDSAPLTALNFPHQRGSCILVCTTTAGHILMWNTFHSKDIMSLMNGFIVLPEDIPRQLRSRFDSSEVGITAIAFSRNDPTFFVIGTESGAILLCSALSQVSSGVKLHETNLYRCVTSYLNPHNGRVLSVSASAFHRNAIFTVGSDNSIRLYSLLQPNKPAAIIYLDGEVTCSKFSISRPLVVITGEASGNVRFHSFDSSKKPVQNLKATEKAAPISSIALCRKTLNLLAAGDHLGRVFIWQLPDTLVSPAHTEQELLNELLEMSQES